ncbi:ligand-binding sensor domain-containing protein [Ulvibacter sp. MAR_2010_11]|uniref:hybrid sensor histidine kinase/response regulator transcription factor n=1 Tax=Ulvibacter sp. MAR_2010_11 TaxID=1250229 RepID=UPI000C2C45F2|nr:hybrid sensor histidine kinase/response regulator transcription factor [Ulvibacter sp. MAR_2010_11]PKA84243.1 ligand-binding sensor domain-containing protein [Ulvibacter sp. MAR_2010_11]
MAQTQKQVSFSQLSVNEGLSQNSVVSIAQDSTGYLWFATQDGLNKYNGKEFTYYEKLFEDVTRENFSKLGKVYVDQKNDLYIITKNGILEKHHRATDSFIQIKRFLNPSSLFMDTHHNLWIGTYGNGLYAISEKLKDTLQIFKGKDVIAHTYAISHFENRVIAATSTGVFSIHPQTLQYEEIPSEGNNTAINYSSITTRDNELWIGTYGNGLFLRKASESVLTKFRGFDAKNTLPDNLNIESILIDSKDRMWLGTYGNGAYLIEFNTRKITQFVPQQSNPKAIHYNDILCIYEDYTGNIWFGTDGTGLSYYDENLTKFNVLTNYEIPYFANVDVTRAIAIDPKGNFWIGTSGKGLTLYDPSVNKFTSFKYDETKPTGIPSNRVMSILAEENRIFIGFQEKGLAILEKGKGFTGYDTNTMGLPTGLTIWCIFKDSQGRYWLGTRDNGLIQFNPEQGVIQHHTTLSNSGTTISSNNVRVIIEGAPGELFIGTESRGIDKFIIKDQAFVHYPHPEIQNIKSLYYTPEYLWIGTNGNGLHAFNNTSEKLYSYNLKDGLPNNVIYAILPDEENNLWLSSNRGLFKFAVENPGDKARIVNYGTYDGLQSLEFNTGAYFKDTKGTLYFGGLSGINWFDPSRLTSNPIAPKTTIYRLEVFTEEVPLDVNKSFNYKENTLSFTFAGLHFSQPERNMYTYFLENHDVNWSKPSNSNYAHYTNLPSGDYTFKVLSSNYDGVWGTIPATYSFTINSPWYLTLWAKLGYIFLFLFILYVVYTYLKSRWSMQVQLQLEHQETERLKKLDELKTKLYTNISHEFRTPLTLISGPVNQLISNSVISEKDKKALHIIDNSSKRMLRLVNQLLELSQLEAGSVHLKVGRQELYPQIFQIIEAFKMPAHEKGIHLKTNIIEFNETWYDKDVMEKIVSNLLSNAVKYAPDTSEILVKVSEVSGFAEIEVANKNESLTPLDLQKLFGRFYQHNKDAEGVGIGLALIKELATLSGGSAKVMRKTPSIISFIIKIPIEKSKYNANFIISDHRTELIVPKPLEIFKPENAEQPLLLVVEDNLEVRNYIISLFSENFKILEAENGLIGIKKAIKEIPDLIISDIMMPIKDGIALCNTLKDDFRTSHIPIILLTAKVGDRNELEGLQNKADDYITKPFNADILIQKVVNFIETRKELQKRYSQSIYLRPKDIAITPLDESFFESVQTIIDTKITNPDFKAEDFAKELNLSRMQLHRKLKALTGLTTTEFLRSQRLKAAVNLLKTSDLTVSEIAYSVGFNTPSYFIKCFKVAYNTTPSEFLAK